MGLVWRNDDLSFPSRHFGDLCVECKMDHDPVNAEQYCAKVEDYLVKGYAIVLTKAEVAKEGSQTWYLPNFAVINPNKSRKLQVIQVEASKVKGTSYNDALLLDLDFLSSLFSVLLKFHQYRNVFSGDIMKMFQQILMRNKDKQTQGFL